MLTFSWLKFISSTAYRQKRFLTRNPRVWMFEIEWSMTKLWQDFETEVVARAAPRLSYLLWFSLCDRIKCQVSGHSLATFIQLCLFGSTTIIQLYRYMYIYSPHNDTSLLTVTLPPTHTTASDESGHTSRKWGDITRHNDNHKISIGLGLFLRENEQTQVKETKQQLVVIMRSEIENYNQTVYIIMYKNLNRTGCKKR